MNFQDCANNTMITAVPHDDTCDLFKISCRFIEELGDELATKVTFLELCRRNVTATLRIPQIFFNSTEEAHEAAKRGHITSYIQIANNFTESMVDIRDNGRYADDSSFLGREIQIHLDMTGKIPLINFQSDRINFNNPSADQQIAFFVERKLRTSYQMFSEKLMTDCQLPMRLGNLPMRFFDPIFGTFESEYKEFIAPGIVMT